MSRLTEELRQVGLVTLYFLVCFTVVLVLKKLFLAQYDVEFYGVSAAALGALVVGKVVVVLDHTAAGNRFDHRHPLWMGVTYKTAMYTAITLIVFVAEKVFHAYRESGELGEALRLAWRHHERSLILAHVLCIGLAFAGYNVYSAFDRRLGEGTLWSMFVHRPTPPPQQ